MDKPPPEGPVTSGALVVWLKLLALLVGLSAFGLLMFWLSSMARRGG